MKSYFVYILASKRNGTLYISVTGDLIKRVWQHKNNLVDGFTKQYSVHQLVYFEETSDSLSAIAREKQLKNWHRQWKINWINQHNPEWKDLYPGFTLSNILVRHAEFISASIFLFMDSEINSE